MHKAEMILGKVDAPRILECEAYILCKTNHFYHSGTSELKRKKQNKNNINKKQKVSSLNKE